MSTPYLTREELRALSGAQTQSAVARWLKREHWVYALGVDGWPRVMRQYHDQRMTGALTPRQADHEPTWGATRRAA